MNPSFNIKSTVAITDAHLFLFAGEQGVTLAVLDREHNRFASLTVYSFPVTTTAAERIALSEEIVTGDDLARQFYSKTDIVWLTPQSVITPQSFFKRDNCSPMLDLVFGNAGDYTDRHELVLKQHAYNAYRVNRQTEQVIANAFSGAGQWHQFSLMLNFEPSKKDWLYCNFNPGTVTAMLRRNGQLISIGTFEYQTPVDAAYHLLNMCQRFDVNAADSIVTASGMIDESSGLYSELYKYFSGIELYDLPGTFSYTDEIKTYPAHYFSHLFAIAACVL